MQMIGLKDLAMHRLWHFYESTLFWKVATTERDCWHRPLAIAALACTFSSPTACADEQLEQRVPADFIGVRVEQSRLAEVRAGSVTTLAIPLQQLGVILWDEVRLPAPPVRNSTGDARVTAEMNTFQVTK
jgi:hypothetical protein